MPELPEVETITNRLKPLLIDRTFVEIHQLHPKSLHGDIRRILHQPIVNIQRRAKLIRIQFANQENLLIHLKMTGQLILSSKHKRIGGGHPTPDWVEKLPSSHTRVIYLLDTQETLYFNDQRLFGWMKIMTNDQINQDFQKLGPDANSEDFTLEYFHNKIKNRSSSVKQIIMENSIVSGVGNIYACDALNLAQISPFRPAKSLTKSEIAKLYKSIRLIIQKGIYLGGATTDGKYRDIDGMAGKYQTEARVYSRAGKPCLHCGAKIIKEKLAGRGTYYCPECQK